MNFPSCSSRDFSRSSATDHTCKHVQYMQTQVHTFFSSSSRDFMFLKCRFPCIHTHVHAYTYTPTCLFPLFKLSLLEIKRLVAIGHTYTYADMHTNVHTCIQTFFSSSSCAFLRSSASCSASLSSLVLKVPALWRCTCLCMRVMCEY